MSNGFKGEANISKINKNIGEFEGFNKIVYILTYFHLVFLFIIHLPLDVLESLHISQIQSYYVGWGQIFGIFLYFLLGAVFRHFYTLNQTLKTHDLYRKSILAIVLSACTSYWMSTLIIPEELGGGEAKGVFKFLLFLGFLIMIPITISLRSSIIIPCFLGYKLVSKKINPQRNDPQIDHQAWNYIMTGKDEQPRLEEKNQKYYTPMLH